MSGQHEPPAYAPPPTLPLPKPEDARQSVLKPEQFTDVATRSSVKIEMNAKDHPQIRVSVYEGTTDAEMQECLDLAVRTLNAARRKLGLPTLGPSGR